MAYVEAKGLQREAGGAALVRDVLRLADRNGDGVIDRREWVRAYAAINELVRDEEGATESAVGGDEIAPSRGAVAGAETGAAAGTVAGRALRKATSSISDLSSRPSRVMQALGEAAPPAVQQTCSNSKMEQ